MADTGFRINGTDISANTAPFVSKAYVLDRYPELINLFKTAGLYLWGYGAYGQMGNSTSSAGTSSPVQTVAGGANWKTPIVGGNYYTGAIKTDGTLWLWGINTNGALGDGTSTNKSSPVQVTGSATTWKQVAGGYAHCVSVKTDGTLWCWGSNSYGQLGNNNSAVTRTSSPIQVGALTTWSRVSAGNGVSAGIRSDGSLWMWGAGTTGAMGDSSIVPKSSPVQTTGAGTTWRQVAASAHVAAIKTDGTLWCWGGNGYGQVGDGSSGNVRSSPVKIGTNTNWKQVAVSTSNAYYTTSAIKTDGTLWMWGHNTFGQLGDNTIAHKSSPVQTIAGGTNWYYVSGGVATAAIKTDGTLWTWGFNTQGQLGDQTTAHKSSPIQTIAGGNNWRQINASWNITAIREDSIDTGFGTL